MIEQSVPSDFIDLANVQHRNEAALLDKEHVVGVALGYREEGGEETDEQAITVLVDVKLDQDLLSEDDLVPSTLDESKVDVKQVGSISIQQFIASRPAVEAPTAEYAEAPEAPSDRLMAVGQELITPQVLTGRVRPAMGGYSCGHPRVTAGTIGTGCYPARPFPGIPARYFLLSNNHVIANSNFASVGDPTIQPGRVDGGQAPQDTIGRLAAFVPLKYKTPTTAPLNFVDAAISAVPFQLLTREIYYLGYVRRSFVAPSVGTMVKKTGRTTNFTTGRVTAVNATVDVGGYPGGVARFAGQILTTAMSAGGDSGSLVVNFDNDGVGLLFAGSSAVTVLNPLNWVQALLGVRISET